MRALASVRTATPTPNNCKGRPALLRFSTFSSSVRAVSPSRSNSQLRAQLKISAWEVFESGAQSGVLGMSSDSCPYLPGERPPTEVHPEGG